MIDCSTLFDCSKRIYAYASRQFGWLPPLHYTLALTNRCNLNCRFCYLEHKGSGEELSSDEWAKVIKTIPRWAFITFEGGEVALRPDFPALVRLASERALGKVNIITNGTLLNDDFFKLLERTLILGISISLDGLETTHDALRGVSGAFRKSLCSVKKLSSRRFLPVIDIKTVLEPENMHELPALYLLCAELGADYLSLSLPNMIHLKQSADVYDNIDDALKNACFQPDKLSFIFEPDSKKSLAALEKLVSRHKTRLRFAPKMSLSDLMRKVSAESLGKAFSYKNCLYPFVNLDITPSGDVCPCLTVKLGNVRDNSLQEIWRGEKAEQFRRALARDGFWSQCALCCEACVK